MLLQPWDKVQRREDDKKEEGIKCLQAVLHAAQQAGKKVRGEAPSLELKHHASPKLMHCLEEVFLAHLLLQLDPVKGERPSSSYLHTLIRENSETGHAE